MEYQHGGDIYSHEISLDYSANINCFGMPEAVQKAIAAAICKCVSYPDSRCRKLRQALGQTYRVPWDHIICSNGAADAIFQAVQAIKPGKTAILGPTFSEYRQALEAAGSEIKTFLLHESSEFKVSVPDLIEFLDETFDMVILCNPNNPTGVTISGEEMRVVLDHCRQRGIHLLVDECFLDFTAYEREASLISACESYKNLLVLKAFTKMYGMAGVRLGYLISSDTAVLERMEQLRQPWSVSTLAQEAGLAALKEVSFAEKTRWFVSVERENVAQGLEKLGFKVFRSDVNYLLFRDHEDAREKALYEECREKKLLIRWCGNYEGLDGRYYRVCIRTREENSRMLGLLKKVLQERTATWQK